MDPSTAPAPHAGTSAVSDVAEAACRHAAVPAPTLTRDQADRVAELFKVLGDPTRVLILRTLADTGEICVRHLAEAVGMSQSSVSHHLRLLRAAALVRGRRVGREVYYRPDDEHVVQLIAICVDHVAHADAAEASGWAAETEADDGTVAAGRDVVRPPKTARDETVHA